MERKTLERKKCYLVQSGCFYKNINYDEITGRNSIIRLDYMGSAEFEWDALPQSTRRMLINYDFYDVFTFPNYVNKNNEELKVYAPKMFIEHISLIIDGLATGSINSDLKEKCSLNRYLKGEKCYRESDFWWDIDNDFYIFFGEEKEKLILEAQRKMRDKTANDVEYGNFNKLCKYYLLNNPDLDDEAREFLKPKKNSFIKSLIRFRK